jgi:hypothetical protein
LLVRPLPYRGATKNVQDRLARGDPLARGVGLIANDISRPECGGYAARRPVIVNEPPNAGRENVPTCPPDGRARGAAARLIPSDP